MEVNNIASGLFYKNSKGVTTVLPHALMSGFLMIAVVVLALYTKVSVMLVAGVFVTVYAYISMGRAGGNALGGINLFIIIVAYLAKSLAVQYMPLLGVLVLLMIYMNRQLWVIDEKDSVFANWEGVLKEATVEYVEAINKIKGVIDSNKERIVRYRLLNELAQKLTSALEKKQIVDVIAEALVKIIRKEGVRFVLLVRDESTDVYSPAGEEKNSSTLVKGTIKLYKKDPFDEWVQKNRQTLIIKNLDDDFRFKTVRKDWFLFKSMVSIPLFEGINLIGVLKFYSEEPDKFDKDDARFLNYLGDLCSSAVENSLLYQKTKDLAIKDGLTGLLIRRYFIERLEEEIRRAKQTGEVFSYLMIDIDHFKDCNDTHGHPFGDRVLQFLGEFLKDNLRDVDLIGRYGGEEFGIILPNTAENGSRFVAERIRESFANHIIKINDNEGIKLTLSIGGVEYVPGMKLLEVINHADKALYHSKEHGRNKVTFWEDIT